MFTIHAEVEGCLLAPQFDPFLRAARDRRIRWVPLAELVDEAAAPGRMVAREIVGREGAVACLAAEAAGGVA